MAELQKKLGKVGLFKRVIDSLETTFDDDDWKELVDEVKSDVEKFCLAQIELLEDGPEAIAPPPPPFMAIDVANAEEEARAAVTPQPPPKPPSESDPLTFMLRNKPLAGKRVRFETKDGPVEGEVVSLAYPNVILLTDTGHKIPVSPLEIEEI